MTPVQSQLWLIVRRPVLQHHGRSQTMCARHDEHREIGVEPAQPQQQQANAAVSSTIRSTQLTALLLTDYWLALVEIGGSAASCDAIGALNGKV